MRIGYSRDIHKISRSKELYLGGVFFPGEAGHEATSDGDIILHALSEAILTALSMEDLGSYYKEEESKNLSSLTILDFAIAQLRKKNMQISNVVISFTSEHILLSPKKNKIFANLQRILKVNSDQLSVTATRWEDKDNQYSECVVSLIVD